MQNSYQLCTPLNFSEHALTVSRALFSLVKISCNALTRHIFAVAPLFIIYRGAGARRNATGEQSCIKADASHRPTRSTLIACKLLFFFIIIIIDAFNGKRLRPLPSDLSFLYRKKSG